MTLLDLCSYLGLGAVGAATVNLLLGMLLSLRYSPVRMWPHRRINVFLLHNFTAYLALFFTLTHPLVLLFIKERHFGWFDILLPIRSPLQPKLNMAGAGALYLVLFTVVTSLFRTAIGQRVWRKLHYLVFPAAVLLFWHSIGTDPALKDGHPDLLDGGKVFIEICALLSAVAIGGRVWMRGRGFRPAAVSFAKSGNGAV